MQVAVAGVAKDDDGQVVLARDLLDGATASGIALRGTEMSSPSLLGRSRASDGDDASAAPP